MDRPMAWLLMIAAIAAFLGGCSAKQSGEPLSRICAQGIDKQRVMAASQKVLEDMQFVIEKADANAGYISTRPLSAQQFFELWRSDTVGCYNFAQDNLHSVTRIAELNITPQDGTFCITCRVDTRRLSLAQGEISRASQVPSLYSSGKAVVVPELSKEAKKSAVWVDMGPDTRLEARILEKIGRRLSDTAL